MFNFFGCCRKRRPQQNAQSTAFESSLSAQESFIKQVNTELDQIKEIVESAQLLNENDDESREEIARIIFESNLKLDPLLMGDNDFKSKKTAFIINAGVVKSNEGDIYARTQTLILTDMPAIQNRLETVRANVAVLSERVKASTPRPK